MNNEIKYAQWILEQEINGLKAMSDSINNNLIKALDLLYLKEGHVILSGMGKPGHIARKISATFASTGTPSFFLHPAEASHGDLGGISNEDVLLALSLSGNTQELIPMLAYANRFGINIIGITANPESALAKASTVNILMPQISEACPHNLAPTTSTTIMMAIGDVLALSLLKRREFNRDDFKKLHPGGALGKRLLIVSDIMHKKIPIVKELDIMKNVLTEITEKSFGCACVINENNAIIGIITDGDLRRNITNNFLNIKAKDVMNKNPKIVSEKMSAQEATKIMNDCKITSLLVAEKNNVPIGIIHIHDCLRAGLA